MRKVQSVPHFAACVLLFHRHVDCDVVMAEVRETSRKPDEMYPLLERLSPGTRKLEIFARPHNVRPGWVSMGNQLGACVCVRLVGQGRVKVLKVMSEPQACRARRHVAGLHRPQAQGGLSILCCSCCLLLADGTHLTDPDLLARYTNIYGPPMAPQHL